MWAFSTGNAKYLCIINEFPKVYLAASIFLQWDAGHKIISIIVPPTPKRWAEWSLRPKLKNNGACWSIRDFIVVDKKLRYLWNNESLVSGEQGCRHRNNKTILLHAVSPTFRTQPRLAASISARITRCSQQMGGAETARHGRQFSSWVNTGIVLGQAATLHTGIIQEPKKGTERARIWVQVNMVNPVQNYASSYHNEYLTW